MRATCLTLFVALAVGGCSSDNKVAATGVVAEASISGATRRRT